MLTASNHDSYVKASGRSCSSLLQQLAGSELNRNGSKIMQNILFASLNLYWLQTAEGASTANVPWGPGLKLPTEPINLPFKNSSFSRL